MAYFYCIASKISENATDMETSFSNLSNYTTEIINDVHNNNCGDSSNVEYFNLTPNDQQNFYIGHHSRGNSRGPGSYRGPGSSRSTDSNSPMINRLDDIRISSSFEKTHGVSSSFNDNKVTARRTNNTAPKAITSFEASGIHEVLLVNLSKLKYKRPTEIQQYALPIIMNGMDLIASTQTGSGKTAAFVIPILNCLLHNLSKIHDKVQRCDPLAVIVVPTKERVKHIYDVTSRLSENTSIKCVTLKYIVSVPGQKQKIMRGVHIIVATPESLASFVYGGWVTFTALRMIVFDDADLMLKMGFKPEIEFILNNKTMVSMDKRTTILFSTTVQPNDVKQLAKTYLKSNYVSVDVKNNTEWYTDITRTI